MHDAPAPRRWPPREEDPADAAHYLHLTELVTVMRDFGISEAAKASRSRGPVARSIDTHVETAIAKTGMRAPVAPSAAL